MQACGRPVARMREQDVDRDIGAGIELDGGVMAPVMGDFDDPAIDDRYVAARQIGPDIGRNVVTIGEERQPVGPIVEQPDRLVRLRAGPDEAPWAPCCGWKGLGWAWRAISSSDTRSRRAASRASASARKSPITVLTGGQCRIRYRR